MARVIIVTGGFGTLGRATVAGLIAQGMIVEAVDVAPIPETHGATSAVGGVDLTDTQQVETTYSSIAAKYGKIDGVVNLAGGFVWELVGGNPIDSFDRMYGMNLRSAVVSCKAALPYFAGSGATIVNVGAAAALLPASGMAPYAASKAGVSAFTESLAAELKMRVRVNAVLPTILDTPTNRRDMPEADFAEWVTPEDAALTIAFLSSPASVAVTGATVRLSR
jgi:NAD(P)-dependent dehydrogenase (short-subunit alcohol dehydrogenase family)